MRTCFSDTSNRRDGQAATAAAAESASAQDAGEMGASLWTEHPPTREHSCMEDSVVCPVEEETHAPSHPREMWYPNWSLTLTRPSPRAVSASRRSPAFSGLPLRCPLHSPPTLIAP